MHNIIQIFKSVRIFQKPDYTPENRKKLGVWPASMDSASGYVKDGTLFLPSSVDGKEDIHQAELIVLLDDIRPEQGFASAEDWQLYYFRQINSPRPVEIFRIGKAEPDGFELFLDYKDMINTIGHPRREDHKFAELRSGKAVRYRINGKSDFTLSGRKQRHFHEFEYIIKHIGGIDNIEYKETFRISHKKTIAAEACKLVDERKILM